MTQAVILCGGRGTRLSALYADRPKILVPVAGRPFIEWQLDWLVHGGILDIHLAGGYMAASLLNWLNTRGVMGENDSWQFFHAGRQIKATLSEETIPLGTGGGIRFVEPFIRSDPFLVVNGDSLMPDLDLSVMTGKQESSGNGVVMAVTRIEESGRYGTVEFDNAGRVMAFREKASRSEGWINGGVYLMSSTVLAGIEAGKAVSIETEVFPALVAAGRLEAFVAPPPLLDMGTPEGIEAMEGYLVKK